MNSYLLILSFELKFFVSDMFPYEDSETLSVCPYPEKEITLASLISVLH